MGTPGIGGQFQEYIFQGEDGSLWMMGKQISEKVIKSNPLSDSIYNTSEAQAVFRCRQIRGPGVGKRAIVKVRMQIPEDLDDASPDPNVRAVEASDVYASATINEINALMWLTERGCSVTPRLLSLTHCRQGIDNVVPGGWLVFIVMERVPGVALTEFRTYDFAKRQKIRQAFRAGLTELYSHHVTQFDHSLANIMYDEKQDKCYFVDFEDADTHPEDRVQKFHESEYGDWLLDDKKLVYGETDQVMLENGSLAWPTIHTNGMEKRKVMLTVE